MRILIRNLIENALRYSAEKGLIRVSLASEKDSLVLVVEDSGKGVATEDFDKITERFYRGQDEQNTSGAGLGLALVKDIADFHQAELNFGRSELGGLKVSVLFPLIIQS